MILIPSLAVSRSHPWKRFNMSDNFARSNLILTTAQRYFSSVNITNYSDLFRISLSKTCLICVGINQIRIRNVLATLYHLKFYMPLRSVCILFHLSKSFFARIVFSTCGWIVETFGHVINFSHRTENFVSEFRRTFCVIDGTELECWSYGPQNPNNSHIDVGYSGKKKSFTIQYQVIVGAVTGEIYHVYGPIYGSVHDSTIYTASAIGTWLFQNHEYILGDRGYQGCLQVLTPHKKNGDQFTQPELQHNANVSKYRNIVERVFASLKKWGILRQTYRGNMQHHFSFFMACCILETI